MLNLRSFGLFSIITAVLTSCLIGLASSQTQPNMIPEMPTHNIPGLVVQGYIPQELRDESVYKWMSPSFRIENKRARGSIFGSGTMCHYDRATNTAYIITCGHLFEGGETVMFVDTWYKNGVKLSTPARYTAQVIGYDNREDIAFLKFNPDWVPNDWFPIASGDNLNVKEGDYLWSVGCDGGREVATYKVKVSSPLQGSGSDSFLITRENSPRHGRSGGGLMTDSGFYVGICVRSSDPYNGTGTGLFVPVSRITAYAQRLNLGFLLNQPRPTQNPLIGMQIIDRVGPQGTYPKDYIPRP